MESQLAAIIRELKMSALSTGIRMSPEAEERLSNHGGTPLTIHEYATTGGVTMELPGQIYLNAPFDEPYCSKAEPLLGIDPSTDRFAVAFRGERIPVRMLPLPGYLDRRDEQGRLVKEVVMSHADRVRISILSGCIYSCGFCDMAATKYMKRPLEQFLSGLRIAREDRQLPVKHVLLSGGTPNRTDQPYFEGICNGILRGCDIPVDIMMTPRPDVTVIDHLVDWGIHGFSLNVEVFNPGVAAKVIPQKARLGHEVWERSIQRAVGLTGGRGRVRSLLVVGLESTAQTLQGVEFLARLGCDPVLSPFRPTRGIKLSDVPPPTPGYLREVYQTSEEISHRYGVKLGPRCIPCQNNTLTFPDGTSAYYST